MLKLMLMAYDDLVNQFSIDFFFFFFGFPLFFLFFFVGCSIALLFLFFGCSIALVALYLREVPSRCSTSTSALHGKLPGLRN